MGLVRSKLFQEFLDSDYIKQCEPPQRNAAIWLFALGYYLTFAFIMLSGLWLLWAAWAKWHPRSWSALFGRYFYLDG